MNGDTICPHCGAYIYNALCCERQAKEKEEQAVADIARQSRVIENLRAPQNVPHPAPQRRDYFDPEHPETVYPAVSAAPVDTEYTYEPPVSEFPFMPTRAQWVAATRELVELRHGVVFIQGRYTELDARLAAAEKELDAKDAAIAELREIYGNATRRADEAEEQLVQSVAEIERLKNMNDVLRVEVMAGMGAK